LLLALGLLLALDLLLALGLLAAFGLLLTLCTFFLTTWLRVVGTATARSGVNVSNRQQLMTKAVSKRRAAELTDPCKVGNRAEDSPIRLSIVMTITLLAR